jgi:dolichol-phosphate mannosyltransferase
MPADCIIVIPTYNEAENIAGLIRQIIREPRFCVLVVDDNSPDGTARIVQDIASQSDRVKLLSRPLKEGFGVACIAGFKRALAEGADFIFQMDADFSRYVKGGGTEDWGLLRRALSKLANLYSRTILQMSVKDCTSGFRCYRRVVLENIGLNSIFSNGYAFQVETTFRALLKGYKIMEIPINFPDRNVGRSKMGKRDILEAMLTVWRLRFSYGRIKKSTG